MVANWEPQLVRWAAPPSQAEQTKADNAERAIRTAIASSSAIASRNVTVFSQGSYRNLTNIGGDSDVDIGICCHESWFYELPAGMSPEQFGFVTPAPYPYAEFKSDVEDALRQHFSGGIVNRGNKAFDIKENTYRISADAVPVFEYRWWYETNKPPLLGTALLSDDGNLIKNWPEQNYQNGVTKNSLTQRRFKSIVRILKNIRHELDNDGSRVAKTAPSFLIESLVYNVPNESFGYPSFTEDVRRVLAHIFNDTRDDGTCAQWTEVNDRKYLFHSTQAWTREVAHGFSSEAWDFLGFN